MQYNLTPLLNIEQMHRTLYPLRALRDEFGLTVEVGDAGRRQRRLLALCRSPRRTRRLVLHGGDQSDPRGAAAAVPGRLLVGGAERQGSARLERLPLSLRPQPGGPRQFRPGRSAACRAGSTELEGDATYPYDFLYCESTHPVRVDNGPPDPRMPDFVKRWNGEDRPYKFQFVTTTEFGKLLRQQHGNAIGRQRGDWTDHWTDGPGSSAYETGVNRATHEIIGMAEASPPGIGRAAPAAGTPGAPPRPTRMPRSSTSIPGAPIPRSRRRNRSSPGRSGTARPAYAYTAAMEAHDQLARAANALAKPLGTRGPEGIFNLGDLKPEEAFKPSGIDEVLVINTLPWERQVMVEEPEPRGGAAPVGILDCFFNRGSGWGGARPIPPVRRVAGTVPAMGYAFLRIADPELVRPRASPGTIENRHYRIRIDPADRRPPRILRQGARPRLRRHVPGLAPGPVRLRDGRLEGRPPRHRQHRLRPSRLLRRQQEHPLGRADRRQGRDR